VPELGTLEAAGGNDRTRGAPRAERVYDDTAHREHDAARATSAGLSAATSVVTE